MNRLWLRCNFITLIKQPDYEAFAKRLASNAEQFLLDDTHNKILDQQPEMRDTPNGKGQRLRTGVYSSGLIARLLDGNEIVLFETRVRSYFRSETAP